MTALSAAPWVVLLLILAIWALLEPASPKTHNNELRCEHAQQQQGGAKAAIEPVLLCERGNPEGEEYGAYAAVKRGQVVALPAAFRHWLNGILSDPVSLFTAILAVSTIGLWFSTRRLWEGAEAQSRDFKRSVEAALKSADVAEKGLRGAHRPAIQTTAVKLVDTNPGQPPKIEFDFRNNGVGPATMLDIVALIKLTSPNSPAVTVALSFKPQVEHIVIERNTGMTGYTFTEGDVPGAAGMFSQISTGGVAIELNFIAEYTDMVLFGYSSDTRVIFQNGGFLIKSVKVVTK